MRKIIFFILLAFGLVCKGQIVTTFNAKPGTSEDGTHKWDVAKFELYNNGVLMYFEITALKPIRRLNICNSGKVTFGKFKLYLRGLYNSDEKVQYFSKLGWDKVGIGEKRVYALYFGGDGYGGNIPSGVTQVSVKGIEVEADGKTTNWQWEDFTINNPRKNYTNIINEYSAKQKIDANNDGVCGIYEEIGEESNYKLACIKEYGEYKLVYLSSSLGYDWWQVGDIKANLHLSASGIFKADWYMANKTINKDCYIVFDGTTMTVTHLSGTASKKAEETKYLKMYPSSYSTTPNTYVNNIQFIASAPKTVVKGEQFRVSYTVTAQKVKDFRAPSFEGFEVLMGPSSSRQSSTQVINGETTLIYSITYSYILMATDEGEIEVPGATIVADGEVMTSNTLNIKVVSSNRTKNGRVHPSQRQQKVPQQNQIPQLKKQTVK